MRKLSVMGFIAFVASGIAAAQYGTPATLKAELAPGRDLAFAKEVKELGVFSSLPNSVFAPPGKSGERLPAIVLFHACGGVRPHVRRFAEQALQEGYAVLIVDAMRGLDTDCGSPPAIPNARLVKDALDGVAHLAALPQVDPGRIAIVGFSKGALVAVWAASSKVADALRPGTPPIAAAVSMYTFCALAPTRGRPQGAQILQPDTDRPLLMLLAGKDTETPPASCLEQLPKLKARGAPVDWHLYPDATHAWDQAEQNGNTKIAFSGERVTYLYDKSVTDDARKRTFAFLATRRVGP